MTRGWPNERMAELEQELAECERQLVERDRRIAELEARVAELEEVLRRNSSNSGKPPSSDSPQERRERRNRRKREKGKRRRGAQPGHQAHQRPLLPPDKVNRFVDLYPEECRNCGTHLPQQSVGEPLRHQVVEVPPVKPDVTEYRRHSAECECGCVTRAPLPEGVPRGILGPRLQALVALLTGFYHLSRRQGVALLADLFGIQLSLGALSEAEQDVSEAVAPAVEQARQAARSADVKHVDATSWSEAGQARTLWTIAAQAVTVFFVTLNGSAETVRQLLGVVRGLLISDRAKQFGFWAMNQRQICWAHLIRKFMAFAERSGLAGQIGGELLLYTERIFHLWYQVRDGTLSRAQFCCQMLPIRHDVELLLEAGEAANIWRVSGSCKDILAHRAALWTFVDHVGVEPTNNEAERELRAFVQWRKRCYGSQSDRGSRFAERIMSVVHTLRKQERHVLSYLEAACENALHGAPPPSLVQASS